MQEIKKEEEKKERVILIAVDADRAGNRAGVDVPVEISLKELDDLCDTAGAETVGTLVQKLDRAQSGTYLGTGKIAELKAMAQELDALFVGATKAA